MFEMTLALLLAVFLGALISLSGVALGGFFVFRTKREGHESFFTAGSPQGDAGVVPGQYIEDDELEEELGTDATGFYKQQNINRHMKRAQQTMGNNSPFATSSLVGDEEDKE